MALDTSRVPRLRISNRGATYQCGAISLAFPATFAALATLVPSLPGCLADDLEEVFRPAISFQMRLSWFVVVRVLSAAKLRARLEKQGERWRLAANQPQAAPQADPRMPY